jgi:5,10-methylenetetrahydromethanopterin reductase
VDVGLVLGSGEQGTIDQAIAQVAAAHEAGLASVWVTHSTGFDALTLLAVAGREVPAIRLGTAVTPVQTAHPARIAAQARTVNAAIGGRLVLGVGVSHRVAIEGRYGLAYEAPVAYMADYLAIAGPLLEGRPVRHEGLHLSARLALTDEGRGDVPVLVAALQPRMLELAGRAAAGTVTWCCGVATIRDRIAPQLAAAAKAAGRPAPEVVVALPVCLTDDEPGGRAAADALLPGYGDLPAYRKVLDEEGARTPGDIAVVGDERAVRGMLQELATAGCTTFAAIRCGTPEDRARTWELLADVVRG